MVLDYGGINVTVRIKEQQLFTAEDYKKLLQACPEESRTQLSDHGYDVNEDKTLEEIFNDRLKKDYREFYKDVPDARLLDIFALRDDYHNLKVLFKEKVSGNQLDDLYLAHGHYDIDVLRQVVEAEGMITGFPEPLTQAVTKVKQAVSGLEDVNAISIILDLGYLNHIKMLADELADPELSEALMAQLDGMNFKMALRMHHADRSKGFMSAALFDGGNIPSDELIDIVDSDDHERYRQLVDRLFNDKAIAEAITADDFSMVNLEHAMTEYTANRMRDAHLEAFGPKPLISYLWFLQNEMNNIRLIFIGKANSLDHEMIEERMQPINEG